LETGGWMDAYFHRNESPIEFVTPHFRLLWDFLSIEDEEYRLVLIQLEAMKIDPLQFMKLFQEVEELKSFTFQYQGLQPILLDETLVSLSEEKRNAWIERRKLALKIFQVNFMLILE
jgi:hypothetical protein